MLNDGLKVERKLDFLFNKATDLEIFLLLRDNPGSDSKMTKEHKNAVGKQSFLNHVVFAI